MFLILRHVEGLTSTTGNTNCRCRCRCRCRYGYGYGYRHPRNHAMHRNNLPTAYNSGIELFHEITATEQPRCYISSMMHADASLPEPSYNCYAISTAWCLLPGSSTPNPMPRLRLTTYVCMIRRCENSLRLAVRHLENVCSGPCADRADRKSPPYRVPSQSRPSSLPRTCLIGS